MNLKEYLKDYFDKSEEEREDLLIGFFTEYFEYVKSNRLSHTEMMDTLNRLLIRSENDEEYEVSEAIKNLLETIEQIKKNENE